MMIRGDRTCDGWITVCTATGRLTFPEIKATVLDMGMDRVTARVLCDLTQATVADLTAAEIEEIIGLVSRQVRNLTGGKAAIVTCNGVDFGLARMFGTYSEIAGLPIDVKVFRSAQVAREWLDEPDAALQPCAPETQF